MARYLEVAKDARATINALYLLIPEDKREQAAPLIAHIYNYGIRTAPRATQSTVRYRAVSTACHDLPLSISMDKVEKDNGTGTFNRLSVEYSE